MSAAYKALRSRLDEVLDQAVQLFATEVEAGNITSDVAADKLQHLVNTVRRFAQVADAASSAPASDSEAAPMSAHVDVVNMIGLTAAQAPDVLTVDSALPVGFVRLSFGLVNIMQVSLLDVKARQLYLAGGIMRSLEREDVLRLVHWTNNYKLT